MRNGRGDEEKRLSVPPASQAFLIRATSLGSAGMRNRPSTSIAVPPPQKIPFNQIIPSNGWQPLVPFGNEVS